MRNKNRHIGLTLVEQVIVLAGVVVLAAISLPGIKAFFKTFESADAAKTMISSALASARAIAAKEQRYAGIRFQIIGFHGNSSSSNEENLDRLIKASQYMIFIIHDPDDRTRAPDGTNLESGFRAVEGIEPIKLPDSIGVMDLKHLNPFDEVSLVDPVPDYLIITPDDQIEEAWILRDTTSFSIIFSPAGKLIIHDVRIRNRDGVTETSGQTSVRSLDNVFNTRNRVAGYDKYRVPANDYYRPEAGMFVQDDYLDLGLWQELSRRSFIVYEKEKFRDNYQQNQPIPLGEEIYVNPYTGTMINSQKTGN
jgi:Tfp pilus assembly protein PilE